MSCIIYNCPELPDHEQNDCNARLLGGISAAIVLECGHSITDPSVAAQITAAIAAGEAKLIQGVKYGLDAPSPIEIDSDISCDPTSPVNYDRTASWIDANVNDNTILFYNALLGGHKAGGLILYMCDADEVMWIDSTVVFSGGLIVPNDNNDRQRFEGTVKWKDINNPAFYATPVGIFV